MKLESIRAEAIDGKTEILVMRRKDELRVTNVGGHSLRISVEGEGIAIVPPGGEFRFLGPLD
jgi:hypothetical protein